MVVVGMISKTCPICNGVFKVNYGNKQGGCSEWCRDQLNLSKGEKLEKKNTNYKIRKKLMPKDEQDMVSANESEQETTTQKIKLSVMSDEQSSVEITQSGPESITAITTPPEEILKIKLTPPDDVETQPSDYMTVLCNSSVVKSDAMSYINSSVEQLDKLAKNATTPDIAIKSYSEIRNMLRLKLDLYKFTHSVLKGTTDV